MTNFEPIAAILRCPITKESLHFTKDLKKIEPFLLPETSSKSIVSGYINASGTQFYPILEGIICLLPNSRESLHDNVKMVQDFYEDFGWQRDQDGRYQDSALFIEQKAGVADYNRSTMQRLSQFLEPQGAYLLDVASGPVFQAENQALSANFDKRICVDISFRALVEARRNIGDEKGIFINGDISKLPLVDGICDNAMCIHTLYHVPQELQETAIQELVRVTKSGSNVVILYNWAWHSWLMNVLLFPIRVLKAAKRIFRYFRVSAAERWLSGGLYFYPHSPAWFEGVGKKLGVKVAFSSLTSIHQDFVKYYVHDRLGGAALLKFILKMEERYPRYLGRHGAFGYVVFKSNYPAARSGGWHAGTK